MPIKSIIKIPLTIIFIVVIICDLWIAYISFYDVIWIKYDENDGVIGINMRTVYTWENTLVITLIITLSAGLGFLTYRSWIPKGKRAVLTPIRAPITIISILVFVYDLFFVYRALFDKSWPIAQNMEEWGYYPIVSFWIGTILILAILISFQVGLGYLTYKAWFSKSHQPHR